MDNRKLFDTALKLFLFLSPVFIFKDYEISFARGLFFITGSFILFALALGVEPKRKLSNIWLSIFLVLIIVRAFFDNGIGHMEWFNFWIAFAGAIYPICGVLLFYIVYCYADDIKQYFKPIFLVCILNLILVFMQVIGKDFMWYSAPSLCGFMETKTQLGQYSALALPIIFYLNPIFALIPLFTLFLSGSVSSILASALGMAVFGGFKGRILKIKAGVGVLLVLVGLLNLEAIKAKFQCRPIQWQKTLKVALQKPYLGWGYRSFQDRVTDVKGELSLGGDKYLMAHNDYLHTAQEVGFPIVVCVAMFFIGLYKKFKIINKSKTIRCLGASVSIGLINMSGQTFIRYASIAGTFIVILALLCAEIKIKEDKE